MTTNINGVREFNLADATALWVRPEESVILMLDFGRDMTTADFEVAYSEFRWPYTPSAYDAISPGSIDPAQIDLSEIADGILRIEITPDDALLFQDRRMCIKVLVTQDGKTWIASSRTIKVGDGD